MLSMTYFPVGVYLFEINYGNARTMLEVYSNLTKKTTEQRH